MNQFLRDGTCAETAGAKRFFVTKILKASLLCASVLVAPGLIDIPGSKAVAQQLPKTDPNAQMLLKSDKLTYDNVNEIVTATGNVQLDYDGYNVVADRVSYNQKTRRVKAFGNVEILEPSGNRIYAREIDLTDDFSEGFVNAIRVETPDNTRFAAESSERLPAQQTIFKNGVYTACEACKDDPDRAPIWQLKARTVIHDGIEKNIVYKHATFEFFGAPIAYFPYFSYPDPTVKRKSGFLFPTAGFDSELGFYFRQPYFLVTGDSHDLTFRPALFTRQGVLGEAEWRHQLENGSYSIKIAGIDQQDPGAFTIGSNDSTVTTRGMIGSRGLFNINPRWTFGWEVLAQSDNNFSSTYKIRNYTSAAFTNRVYLEGLHDRSFLNLSAKQYLVQNSSLIPTANAFSFESEQPFVRPLLDYNYVTNPDTIGGEVNLDVNVTSLERNRLSTTVSALTNVGLASGDNRTHGINGDTTRASVDLAWQRTLAMASGLTFTPSVSVRGDWTTTSAIASSATQTTGNTVTNGSYTRFMPTAGLEVSYPILARTGTSSHVFEPIAQIFLRPDLGFTGVAPNEDAQSLVFDATTLFQRDKFSGYDRIESGTRANIGLRYSGVFENGLALNALIGQSFHLAGQNPYAREDDLTNTGEESGLETNRSDYVAAFSASGLGGLSLNTQARFDERDFDLKRGQISVGFAKGKYSLGSNYTFIAPQPDYSALNFRQQIGIGAGYKFAKNWQITGGAQYDIEAGVLVSDSIGLSYADECFTFTLSFAESRPRFAGSEVSRSIGFKIGLRTIGEYAGSVSDAQFEDFSGNSNP